jgi:hypothetical protein
MQQLEMTRKTHSKTTRAIQSTSEEAGVVGALWPDPDHASRLPYSLSMGLVDFDTVVLACEERE